MEEYIGRNSLLRIANERLDSLRKECGFFDHYTSGYEECVDRIEEAPTADVVEVVRCKDCRHKNELNKYEKTIYADGCVACSFISATGDRLVMLGDAFCSYGAKMDGKGEGE